MLAKLLNRQGFVTRLDYGSTFASAGDQYRKCRRRIDRSFLQHAREHSPNVPFSPTFTSPPH